MLFPSSVQATSFTGLFDSIFVPVENVNFRFDVQTCRDLQVSKQRRRNCYKVFVGLLGV